ncbi:vacuolar carboxypeptidase Y [Scheffersomyces coipomensis]|uniref:vacuolar carboxypeptidase Y n=1 Tax=Scheffersomyces coipomensis TaxID=1788519 RepID=UPI00315D87C8
MNIDIIEPINRIHLSSQAKITSLLYLNHKLYVGFNNGDLSIYSTTTSNDDNNTNEKLKFDTTFQNVTRDHSSIDRIEHLPISNDHTNSKVILIISTIELFRVFEIIGTHVNLIQEVEIGVDFVYYKHNDTRWFITGIKKKLTIYKIINKTRNILQFQKFKDITLKDRVKSIAKYNESNLLIGLINEYILLDYDSFDTKPLTIEGFGNNSSFSYFGLSGSSKTWNIPIIDNEILLIKDNQSILLNNDKIIPTQIKLSSTIPIHIIFLSPIYLLIVYNKKLEIIDYSNGDLIQKFHHQISTSNIQITVDQNIIFLSSNSEIVQFKMIDYQKQIDQYLTITGKGSSQGNLKDPQNDLKIIGLNKAIKLVSKLDHDHKFFGKFDHKDREKQKQLILRKLYKRKAMVLFESYSRYQESLVEIGSEWLLSFRDVLGLFPDFLNGEKFITKKRGDDDDASMSVRSIGTNVIKRVSLQDVQKIGANDESTESPTPSIAPSTVTTSNNNKNNINPTNIKKFTKAVKYLIIYLTDQRRINSNFLNDLPLKWKGVEIIPSDLYSSKHNNGNIKFYLNQVGKIIDTSLFLCYFYTKPMLLGPLLRLPNNFCDAKVVNDCLLSTHQIRELLDFYYGRHIHDSALEMLYKLSHEGGSSGPELTIQYLTKLNNDDLELIFQFSYWVIMEENDFEQQLINSQLIFMNETYECESYDNFKVLNFFLEVLKNDKLGINYLEWLIFKSEKLKISNKFYTKLILLYIEELKEISKLNPKSSLSEHATYKKLYNFLETTTNYDPWIILKQIPFENDEFLRFVIFIYKKLGEHEKSIDILFNQLNDLDNAMKYCCDIYIINKTTGQNLLQKLLEDLLINYDENEALIEKLLNLQGSKMSILMVLTSLPKSFPLFKLSKFLNNQIINSQQNNYDSRIISQLYKVGSIKLYDKILNIESENYSIQSNRQICSICNKRLGYSVFTVDKHDQIIHYGCAQKGNKVT